MNTNRHTPLFFIALCFSLLIGTVSALDVPKIFGSNMVLQRSMDLKIPGTAQPGAEVVVSFADQTVTAKADSKGAWEGVLKPMEASAENRTLSIKSGDKELIFENVLVGEVWLGSGQSNMAGRVGSYAKRDSTLAALAEKEFPNIRLLTGSKWESAKPASINAHSAILFPFGERLHRELDVPVGLFYGAVGGTPSGAWIPKDTFDSSEKIAAVIAEFAKTYDAAAAEKQYKARLAKWEEIAAKAKADGKKVRGRKPAPPGGPGSATRRPIGGLFDQHIKRHVGFPIRGVLWDQGEARTGVLGLDQHTCMSELIRGWREKWGQDEFPFLFVQKPSGMGNAFSKDNPITREASQFSALPSITSIGTGEERYLYTRLMHDNPNAWMVPCCDLGGMVHPINKWGYGNRAAEVALQKVYKKEGVQAYGPIYQSHQIDGSLVTIKFTEVGSGLTACHSDTVQGFALAGEDGKWHWAKAEIKGSDSIVLSSEMVKAPKKIRFAYAKNRAWANLFNKEGLPALAFTTE